MAELQILTEDQVSRLTGLGKNTLKALRRKGEGPRVTVLSSGRIGYQMRHIREWMDTQSEGPEPQMGRDQQTDAALRVLAAVKKNIVDDDPEGGLQVLRGSSREVSMRLAEATNLLVHLCKLSPQPEAMLAALVEAVTNEKHPGA
jgi:predicted DNA-binding transcriptional regulator AlpA